MSLSRVFTLTVPLLLLNPGAAAAAAPPAYLTDGTLTGLNVVGAARKPCPDR